MSPEAGELGGRPSLRVVLALALAAVVLGLGSAALAVRHVDNLGQIRVGPWVTSSTAGSADAGLYQRATVAVHALFVLNRSQTVYFRALTDDGGNRIHHARLPDASWRTVVMPSPDQLYSACAFDVGDRPLLVTAEVPDGYWSLSLFADDTTNFYVLDDRQVKDRRARVVVTGGQEVRDPSAAVVRSPSSRGVVLFRLLVLDRKDLPTLERIQHAARCEPLAGG